MNYFSKICIVLFAVQLSSQQPVFCATSVDGAWGSWAEPLPEGGAENVLDESANPTENVATIASTIPEEGFNTFLMAVTKDPKDGLLAAISDPASTLTVFAPNDEAFANELENMNKTLDEFLAMPDLSDMLKLHILPQKMTAEELVAMVESLAPEDGVKLPTLAGSDIEVTLGGDDNTDVLVNGVKVVTPDVEAGMSVIHVISGIITPEPETEPPLTPETEIEVEDDAEPIEENGEADGEASARKPYSSGGP